MFNYKFQANEGRILAGNRLLLTTHNLVWENNGFLSKERVICPLNEIKVIDGRVQAFMGGTTLSRSIELHFIDGEHKDLSFSEYIGEVKGDAGQKREIIKWLKALSVAITGAEGDYEESEKNVPFPHAAESARAGREIGRTVTSAALGGGVIGNFVGSTLGGTVGGIAGGLLGLSKKKRLIPSDGRASANCSGCGSPISGLAGQTVCCPYCDTEQKI